MTPVSGQEKFSMPESDNINAVNNDYMKAVAFGNYKPRLSSSEDSLSLTSYGTSQNPDDDPINLLQDIDEVLMKEKAFGMDIDSADTPVAKHEVLDAGEFLAIRDKKVKDLDDAEYFGQPSVTKEESCPELGINLRDGGPTPKENLDHYNIQLRRDASPEPMVSLFDLLQQLRFLQNNLDQAQTCVPHYTPGLV